MLANPNFHFPGRQNMIPTEPPSPTPLSTNTDAKSKRRSSTHSRQLSLSNASSQSSPTSPARPTSSSRPVSGHHRRQSSVSSRRESREMMGLASPTDASEESFPGDSRQHALWALEGKKSVPGLTIGFTKVEIPDWQTPDGEKEEFSWPNSALTASNGSSAKRTLTPGSSTPLAYTPSSSLANKRDSFGKSLLSASSSLKEQLHTLMEEDEDAEEEEDVKLSPAHASEEDQAPAESTTSIVEEPESITEAGNESDVIANERVLEEVAICTPVVPNAPFDLDATPLASSTSKLPSTASLNETPASPSTSPRPRPPTLQLRPLSLVSSLPMTSQTSAVTNNTIPHSIRYKSLTLATNLPATQTTTTSRNANDPPKRHSLLLNGAQFGQSSSQLATNLNRQRRRGSMGYRRSGEDHNPAAPPSNPAASLRRQSLPMTPGLTPNTAVSGRSTSPSTPSDSISSSRASSEFFQSQAVTSLLSRIRSLEEALALSTAATSPASDSRMSFPPLERLASLEEEDDCVVSKAHMSRPSRQSTDDLIDIIAELKTERDELNNDIVGWRTRCADLTHSTEALQRRLADERRELCLLHQRLSSVTTDLNESRSAKLKLEDELVSERASNATNIRERQKLEEEVNEERMVRIGMEMKTEKERLAWQKERNGWETERKGWFEERIQLEETLKRCEDTIASLRAQLDDRTRQLEKLQGTPSDTAMASKLKQPWTGGKFAFPAPSGPPRPESPEQPRPRTSTGFGGLNPGFKFGAGPSAPSSGNSTPRPLSSSPLADGPIPPQPLRSVVEEEEENPRYSYDDEGDADAAFPCSDDDLSEVGLPSHSSPASAVNLNSPLPSPTSSPVPAPHQHRRSVSRVTNWRFPSPRTLEQRRNAGAPPGLKDKKDRFFACLEDDEDDEGRTAPRLIGKPMKAKEHKKLPSGCPAFWLDCDDEDQALKREAPLPSPATTEEEDDTETDSVLSRSPTSTALSFPLIPRTIVTPASASPSRSSSPVDAPVTVLVAPPVSVPTPAPTPRPAAPRSASPSAPSVPRVAAPVFIPATNSTVTPLPVTSFPSPPLTTVPPAPKPSMTIPPSINVANNAVGSAPISPSQISTKVAPTASGYFGRLPTLSSMISWGAPRKAPDSEDDFPAHPATSSSTTAPSPPAKTYKAKHVDPEVMRERLRLQLEREGRLSPTKLRAASGKVVMSRGGLPVQTSIESCGSCSSRNVLEL